MNLRNWIPFPLRVEALRAARLGRTWLERGFARERLDETRAAGFGHVLASHASPLARPGTACDPRLQRGKEANVALAARALDRLLVRPFETASYHRAVGRPSRRRGFRPGLELHDGRLSSGIGGGCCQVANCLFLLALEGGMRVAERHRHGLDLFPDAGRTVPFGCGATVFYNYVDLRFENPLPDPILLRVRVADGMLRGELRAALDPGWRVEVYETDHRFFEEDGHSFRENRIRRRFLRDGRVLLDQEIAHNRVRVLYERSGC